MAHFPTALIWLALSPLPATTAAAEARMEWSLDLPRFDAQFGGLSAIEADDAGTHITVMSDRGGLYSATVSRIGGGAALSDIMPLSFLSPDGRPMTVGKNDTEGLAFAPSGERVVSTENPARVLTLGDDGATAPVETPDSFREMQTNGSLEALAIGPDGAVYTMPERSGRFDEPFPVYRYAGGLWDVAFALPRDDAFLPVGADFGPDGRLYILERDFGPLGFRSRVFSQRADGTDRIVELETQMGDHGNLEGLAVWRDAGGRIRLLMVADDNFSIWQRSELVEYSIQH